MSSMATRRTAPIRGGSAAAGSRTRLMLREMLGLSVPGTRWAVKSAVWTEACVKAEVAVRGKKPILFKIEPARDGSRGIVKTDRLVVSYIGKNLPQALGRLISERGSARLAGHDMASLGHLFIEDPEYGKGGLPVPDAGAMSNRPDSLLDSWGESSAWADFFAVDELARGNLDSLDNLFVFLQHGDIECEHLFPHGPAPVLSLVRYPWEHEVRTGRHPRPRSQGGGMMITSELNEDDVIMGNPEKLKQALRLGAKEAERRKSTLFVSNTCVPVVTGEDVESEFRRCTAECTKTPLYLTIGPGSMINVFQDLLVDRRKRAEAETETAAPNIINLLGFSDTPDLTEIRSLLEEAGVEVNAVLIPEVSEELVDQLPRAALNVIRPASAWEHLYQHVTADSRLPNARPTAPVGIAGTKRWLREVLEALGLSGADKVFEERLEPLRERWDRLKNDASKHRLGLVVRAREVHNITEPATTWGIPLVETLEEMGFGLDILLMFEQPEDVQVAKKVHEALSIPERHSIKGFDTFERMQSQLESMEADAVFTHHTYDWRVTQAGKNMFSLQHFELGPEGALRTADRLLNICRTTFFKRFAPYLRRTREGERTGIDET